MKSFFRFLATGFDSGFIKGAPGTYGTVVAVLLYLLLHSMPQFSYLLFAIAFVFFSVWVTKGALPGFDTEDPSEIVIDEMAGFFVTMIWVPFSWMNVGLGFILFRLFDIVKPFPIRLIDRKVKGAWGIVLDDVLAGVFANIMIWAILYVLSKIAM